MSTRTLMAGAALFSGALAVPLILEVRNPVRVDPEVQVRAVTVRNDCPRTVWIYFGVHPPLRTQDMFALGPHMQSVEPTTPGSTLWLLDHGARELDRAVFGAEVKTIRVLPSCTQLRADVGG